MQKTVVPTSYRLASKLWLFTLLALTACAHDRPTEEWALAHTALDWGRQVQASRHAPGLWFKADSSYKKALQLFEERDFKGAEREFTKARHYAERAENLSRLKRFRNSEVL